MRRRLFNLAAMGGLTLLRRRRRYPESLELPDGRVLTVYYYNLFGRYFLGGTYWKPSTH